MPRVLPLLVGLAATATPLAAQVGLASSSTTVLLTATKRGSIGVTLPSERPEAITTAWDLNPAERPAVALVAYFDAPGSPIRFTLPVSETAASGSWGDALRAALPLGTHRGTLNLLAITQ